jgi:hypothetical protein
MVFPGLGKMKLRCIPSLFFAKLEKTMNKHKLAIASVFGLSFLFLSLACSSSVSDTTAVDTDSI